MLALSVAALLASVAIVAHPMHTAVAEVNYDTGSRTAAIRIRVFADDFAIAMSQEGATPSDSVMSRYVRGTFALSDRSGRPLPLRWIGAEREGDVVVLHLRVRAPGGLARGKVLSALLSERFEDQVNIVRVSCDGRASTLLFTRGEPAKALP
jgi:uncharacterized protein DUF6702